MDAVHTAEAGPFQSRGSPTRFAALSFWWRLFAWGDEPMDPLHKAPLRRRLLEERRALDPGEVHLASVAIASRIRTLPELGSARTIALYQALRNEIEMTPLWEALAGSGMRILFPRIVSQSRILAFAPVDDPSELEVGALGVAQPPEGSDVPLGEIDVFVVPALAFDLQGRRLGRGGGYYDATLSAAPGALRIGPCLDDHLLEGVPAESHDQAVDVVVTPRRVLRSRRR